MLLLNKFFDHAGLIAFTTDNSVDFTLNEASPDFNDLQKACLDKEIGNAAESLIQVRQVHGANVVCVDHAFLSSGSVHEADALVTNLKGIPIAVRTADCLPIFIFDPAHNAVGIIHGGWKSTQAEIFKATFEVMKSKFQTDYEDILVSLGPAIRSCCYEVGVEFVSRFKEAVIKREGKYYLDLIKANRDQMYFLGVERHQLFDCRVCTCCDKKYFSFRRDGQQAGRMLSVMMIK